jgi:hypothetical protein
VIQAAWTTSTIGVRGRTGAYVLGEQRFFRPRMKQLGSEGG